MRRQRGLGRLGKAVLVAAEAPEGVETGAQVAGVGVDRGAVARMVAVVAGVAQAARKVALKEEHSVVVRVDSVA